MVTRKNLQLVKGALSREFSRFWVENDLKFTLNTFPTHGTLLEHEEKGIEWLSLRAKKKT